MHVRTQRALRTVVLAVALGALVAGGAQAAERPDDRGGMLGVGATTSAPPSDVVERAVERLIDTAPAPPPSDVVERAVQRLIDARRDGTAPGSPKPTEGTFAAAIPSSDHVSPGSGLDWGDAGLGAAVAAIGVVLVGAVATLTFRHRKRVAVR